MDRNRLTITLGKSTLNKIDELIDGTQIRNRSHAIESLILQSLTPRISQAVVLAGGKGLNMRPFTYEMPKGLFPVGGKPILDHIVEKLVSFGIREIIFSLGHLGEKIKDHFGDGRKFGVKFSYKIEEDETSTGGALRSVMNLVKSNTFLVIHGDILIDVSLTDLVNFHKKQQTIATIALSSVVDPSSFGEVIMQGTRITRFIEKPEKGKQESQLVSCGLYVFEKKIFSYLPKTGFARLEDLFPKLAQGGELSGFLFAGRWVDIGTPKSYEKAIKEWGDK